MTRLESYEQYKQAVTGAKARGLRSSNCFFLPAAVKEKIEAGTLHLLETDRALFLLEDGGGFYRCYFYLPEGEVPEPLSLDRQAVIEFPFSGEPNERQLAQIGQIRALGFRLGRESGLMTAAADRITDRPVRNGLSPEEALPADRDRVAALLRECFDPRYAFLPGTEELEADILAGRVQVLRQDGQAAAVLVSGCEKQTAVLRLLAVDPARRRMGLGAALVNASLGLPIREVEDLAEISLGAWDGRLIEEVKREWPAEYARRGEYLMSYRFDEGSESFYMVQHRVRRALVRLLKADPSPDVLILSHAGVVKCLWGMLQGRDIDWAFPRCRPEKGELLVLKT